MSKLVPFPWDAFGQLQASADGVVLSPRNHAREEALGQLLDDHARGMGPVDAETLQRRFASLSANRAKKYRRHGAAAGEVAAHMRIMHRPTDVCAAVDVQQLVDLTMEELTGDEIILADLLTRELSYGEMANVVGKPVGTVKAQVSRMRRRIRATPVGEHVLALLAA